MIFSMFSVIVLVENEYEIIKMIALFLFFGRKDYIPLQIRSWPYKAHCASYDTVTK